MNPVIGAAGRMDPGTDGRARTMKHIAGTALRVTTCLVLAVTGLALLAGKDDIRKFRRMRRCRRAGRYGK